MDENSRTRTARSSSKLRVLMWMPRGSTIPGGHKVQMEQTGIALRRIGLAVTIGVDAGVDLDGYDIVHGFGLGAAEIRRARRAGAIVALSTIYNSRSYRAEPFEGRALWARARHRSRKALRLAAASLAGPDPLADRCSLGADRDQIAAYEAADLLLPNSTSEAEAIRRELGVTTSMHVTPNAVSSSLLDGDTAQPPLNSRTTVLCLGRIEPHKNQLGVIRALAGTDLDVEIAGPAHPHHGAYVDRCRAEAGPRVRFVGLVEQGGDAYLAMLDRARVHVLASWFETTGLSSLEAAARGANVVTTSRGFAADYFGDLAWYCDPARPESIRQAVLQAWGHPGHPELRERIRDRYTWDHCAEVTAAAYVEALEPRHRHCRRPG